MDIEGHDRSGPLLRVDLHTHTHHSPDATLAPAELVERALDAGLDRVAITDHNTLDGALEARLRYRDQVIVGEEIDCRCGLDIIGLFLTERIPPGLALEEVVERIRDQGGVVYAPHPYAYAWRPSWYGARALRVADLVEGFNSRAFLPMWNRRAMESARAAGVPIGAGTDAHFPWEVGRAYTEMPAFNDAREFLTAARAARPVGVTTAGPLVHVASMTLKYSRLAVRVVRGPARPEHPRSGNPAPAGR